METLLFLVVDGVTNGAVYGLVALSLIVVFTVTRVVNIAQGEYITLGALSFASATAGGFPPLCLPVLAGIALFAVADLRERGVDRATRLRRVLGALAWMAAVLASSLASLWTGGAYWVAAFAALVLTASVGPLIYRLTVEPMADAPQISLVIVTVGVYMVVHGATVLIWGAEPRSVPPISSEGLIIGPVFVPGQSVWICALSVLAMAGLYLFAEHTLAGKALKAVAINRVGAQLCAVPVRWAGQASFALGAAFSALSGLLLAPLVTANYDMGLPIALKGFVAAALGGLMEYPTALAGVALVGMTESFAAFHFSAFREVIVYLLVIPILLWRNAVRPPQDLGH